MELRTGDFRTIPIATTPPYTTADLPGGVVEVVGGLAEEVLDDRSLGQRQFVEPLACAAMAVGVDGLFMETHPDPDQALSDGPNAWPLGKMRELLAVLKDIDSLVKKRGFAEASL